jgi:PilZ domain
MPEDRKKTGNSAVAVPSATQRAHPRYQFTATAEALDAHHRLRMNARTSDLGKGGCYVDTFSPFPMKTGVKLRITKEKVSFEAEATVVYSKIGMGMGLAFTSIDPQQMGVLEKWLNELSGSPPTELSLIQEHKTSPSNGGSAKEPGYVLSDLIVALMRKGTLSEEEGRTMLLRLVHHDFRP